MFGSNPPSGSSKTLYAVIRCLRVVWGRYAVPSGCITIGESPIDRRAGLQTPAGYTLGSSDALTADCVRSCPDRSDVDSPPLRVRSCLSRPGRLPRSAQGSPIHESVSANAQPKARQVGASRRWLCPVPSSAPYSTLLSGTYDRLPSSRRVGQSHL